MNCPRCQKQLPDNYAADWCPFCGSDLPPSEPDSAQPQLPSVKTRWPIFFGVLLAPVVLTIFAVLLGTKDGDAPPAVASFAGGAAGIVCGVILGRRLGKTTPMRIFLGVLFAVIMMVVCIGMSCFGCLTSGYRLNFH